MKVERDIKIIEAILFASGEPVLEDDLKVKIINTKYFDSYMLQIKSFYKNRWINLTKNCSNGLVTK